MFIHKMSIHKGLRRNFLVLSLLWCSFALAQESPGLGVPASPEEVAGWDISIGPEGENLPAGSGTAAQGASIYAALCFSCHGTDG